MAIENEEQAFEAIMGAVMAPDAQELDQAQRIDEEPDEEGLEEDSGERAEVEGEEKKTEAKAEEVADPDDDFVEIELEGGAKEKLAIKDLVASHRELKAIEGQKHEIISRVRDESVHIARQHYQEVQEYSKNVGVTLMGALQLLKAPQDPDPSMLDRNSRNYDPDAYHMQRARADQARQQLGTAQEIGQRLLQQAQDAEERARGELEQRELERLQRAWPEFGQEAVTNKFVQDMGKAYGFTRDELDAVLTDHRQALVARDALAYRAMKAESGTVKKAVEAKAPKIVRGKTEAKVQLRQQDAKGRFISDAKTRLAKDQSDEAGAAYFASLIKAGRI